MVRGWKGGAWRQNVRRANLSLAVAISGVALFLALPILDFGAISARNQVARLERGAVSAEDFDYSALRGDFGAAGRRALVRLERSANPQVAELAGLARRQTERSYPAMRGEFRTADEIDVRVEPDSPELRRMVVAHLRTNSFLCDSFCIALDLGPARGGGRDIAFVMNGRYQRVSLPSGVHLPSTEVAPAAAGNFGAGTKVEVGTIEKRYILVDGKPVGPPLD